MVRKLFKHELYSYVRVLFPVWAIFAVVTVLARLFQFMELAYLIPNLPEWFTDLYDVTVFLLNGSALLAYLASAFVCIGFSTVLIIVRFYKHFFTGEGYLTFTLPVTVGQHLMVKVAVALLMQLFTGYLLLLSGCVVTFGPLLVEIVKAVWYLLVMGYKEMGLHLPLLLIQYAIVLFLACLNEILFYHHCLSLGQLFPKARLLGAVGVYFGYYLLSQVLSTVLVVVIWVAMFIFIPIIISIPGIDDFAKFLIDHNIQYYYQNVTLAVGILSGMVSSIFYYLVTYFVIRKRLNLE